MFGADLAVKWIHVSSACLLLGSLALMLAVPALGSGDSNPITELVMSRAKTIVHGSLGVLLLTGAYNFWRVLTNNTLAHSSVYQDVLGVKMVLFLIILGLAIVALKRAAGSAATPRARRLLPWMVFLTLLVVLLSTYLNLERIHLLVQDAETSAVTAPAGTG